MNKRDTSGLEESIWQGSMATSPAAWDPYEVWLTRVKQPRESSARRRPSSLDAVSSSATPSPAARWSPSRRATSPRS
jgi:hypothetical protein